MSEWLKEHGWKPCKHESASRVRIPLSPPVSLSAKCRGDVAQLGERLVRNEEVTGSIPVISTSFSSTAIDPRALESRRWPPRGLALTASSRAIESHELREDRKVAAVSDRLDVPRIQLTRARSGGAVAGPLGKPSTH